jgi:D-glycero-D-manno-heptose 1,7-bisphosphate phosphatase
MGKHLAIFLKRDGTILEDLGYIKDPSEVIFYPTSIKALNIQQRLFLLFISTNQSGISKGIATESKEKECKIFLLNRQPLLFSV